MERWHTDERWVIQAWKKAKVAQEEWNWEEEKQENDVVFLVASLIAKAWFHYDMISPGIIPYKRNQYRWFTWQMLTPSKVYYHSQEN